MADEGSGSGSRRRLRWRPVLRPLRPHRSGVVLLSAASFVGGAAEAVFLGLVTRMALAIADGLERVELFGGRTVPVALAVGMACLLLVIRLLLGLVVARLSAGLTVAVLTDIRRRLADSYLHTSWAVQHGEPSGRLQELLGWFSGQAADVVRYVCQAIGFVFTLVALVIASLVINPLATVFFIGGLIVIGSMLAPLRKHIRLRAKFAAAAETSFATSVAETSALGLEIQAFGVRDQFARRVDEVVAADGSARQRALAAAFAVVPAYVFLAYGAVVAALSAASALGTTELEGAAAVMLVMLRSLTYGQGLQSSLGYVVNAAPYVDVIDDTVEHYVAHRATGGDRPIADIWVIEANSVSFAYSPAQEVLHDVSVRIERGDIVGLVGPTAAGKSTLVQLLLGLRDPSSGRVDVDGVDLRDIDRRCWTSLAAFVPQDAVLFSGTVADNIAFFRDGIDSARIEQAARQAHIADEIAAMPRGFSSEVGARGGSLSGGQRQRLSIARALAGDPQLLIMDEPTSALDARTESLIRQTIEELRGRVTMLIIAHRNSTLEVCDRIIVLDGGRVRAIDTPARLAASDPFYRESLQLLRPGAAAGLPRDVSSPHL